MISLNILSSLLRLEELLASENEFACPKELGSNLSRLPFLKKVDLHGCPAQKDTHYREKITAGSLQIGIWKYFI